MGMVWRCVRWTQWATWMHDCKVNAERCCVSVPLCKDAAIWRVDGNETKVSTTGQATDLPPFKPWPALAAMARRWLA